MLLTSNYERLLEGAIQKVRVFKATFHDNFERFRSLIFNFQDLETSIESKFG